MALVLFGCPGLDWVWAWVSSETEAPGFPNWLVSEPPGPGLYPTLLGLQVLTAVLPFMWLLGNELWSSCLQSKHLTH